MGYKDKDKRRQYLIDYRNKTRNKRREYSRNYYRNIGAKVWREKYYKYKYIRNNKEALLGTSGLGRKYEKLALQLLDGSIDCNAESFSGKWDIKWNGLKIDVKMRNKNKKGRWGFTTKPKPIADYFLCFCIEEDKIKYIYFIPAKIFKEGISLSDNLKYKQFFLKLNQK